MACEQQIRFAVAVRRGCLTAAQSAIDSLASVSHLEAAYWLISSSTIHHVAVTG